MRDRVGELHDLRESLVIVNDLLIASRLTWELQNEGNIDHKASIVDQINELEADIKAQRVADYDGKDKGKVFGVGIRETTVMDYHEGEALDWCKEHDMALQMDKRAFESIAKSAPH